MSGPAKRRAKAGAPGRPGGDARSAGPVAIIGTGRAGLGLALALKAHGADIAAVVSRRGAGARRASSLLGRRVGTTRLDEDVLRARVILICVPDTAIAGVARRLASQPLRGRVVLHTSGATGPGILEPLRRRGAATGCLHPLTAFPPPGSAVPDLRGIHFAIDGVPAASRRAGRLARLLGGRVLRVPARSRVAYHLAASLTANGLVALLDAGIELAVSRLGLSEPQARAALVPLARTAVEGVARRGARRALTGPAARGDVETIRKHLIVLRSAPADVARLYRLLALRTVRLALADGRVSASRAAGIRRLLSAGRRAPARPARAD